MKILIFEDEQYNFDLLCEMLRGIMPDCSIIGPISSVSEGRNFFADTMPTLKEYGEPLLIIADIQLDDGLSFYALNEAPADVPIIFTTAYDEYALRAFEYNSLSYLLKPIDEEELRLAIRKTQERLITDEHRDELFRLLAHRAHYRERFLISTYNGERVVTISEVRYFVSERKSTYIVFHDGMSHTIDLTLTDLAEQLDPQRFMRVNRKYIIPINEVDHFEMLDNGKELLILKGDESPEIIISRDNKQNVHHWVE